MDISNKYFYICTTKLKITDIFSPTFPIIHYLSSMYHVTIELLGLK